MDIVPSQSVTIDGILVRMRGFRRLIFKDIKFLRELLEDHPNLLPGDTLEVSVSDG